MQADDQNRAAQAEIAEKKFELSQSLPEKWLKGGLLGETSFARNRLFELFVGGVSLVSEMRKSLVALAEGQSVLLSRGDSPFTIVNETVDLRFLRLIIPQHLVFKGNAITRLVKRGRYANTRALRKAAGK